jgi:hypothetical protein
VQQLLRKKAQISGAFIRRDETAPPSPMSWEASCEEIELERAAAVKRREIAAINGVERVKPEDS